MFHEVSWRAACGDLQVVLRQRGEREFQVSVSNGRLTHLHPVTDCDLEAAKTHACHRVAQFESCLSPGRHVLRERPAGLDWELIDSDYI